LTTLHVACAVEGHDYVAHCATMLHSVLAADREHDVRIHFMHGPDLAAADRRALAAMVDREGGEIDFVDVPDERVEGLPTKDFTRKATWYRIFLPEMRAGLDRVIYLDADMIVVDSLVPLYDIDLEGNWVGAVTNVFMEMHKHRPVELGLAGTDVYFNAGVLVMDLQAMRSHDLTHELLRYGVDNADRLAWRDQDTLNVVLGHHRLALHPRWNVMNSFRWEEAERVFGREALREARENPAIRHFEGPDDNKPWHFMCDHDLRELYMCHRRATPWPRMRREGLTPRNVVRRARRRRYSARGVR
jgi:lipopolysaccharide biosynthesis glycosyltransferase